MTPMMINLYVPTPPIPNIPTTDSNHYAPN